ncbi:LOW QUALITY PROTEIN: ribonucleases P/MRP protein subunit POP1-like [Pyrus x bretschneideri]|uniref:LOW QUALITY PROTEIN: ribonucleases P/MRP protein subunit POP1-like n=1 Tax=Pyrus x bretschneideri TaxID=225117 RepID=UPI00202FEE59|nr:LOW QUALITY PROTEIN: ribonucleases P/MRP protein subunit POP1-like [Pyrus x bretschneideri]
MATDGFRRQQVSSTPPRKINVQKFAESRGSELETLHSIVSNRLNNDFRSWRSKRRTTAYDNQAAKKRYRKKRKLDQSNALTLPPEKDDKKNVPRRIRRRAELKMKLEKGFCTSGDGTKRLRTHVWHAKRFTMTKLWGYYLPLGLQGRGRGSRAVLEWFRDGVLVHDAIYHVAIQLEGPEVGICFLSYELEGPDASYHVAIQLLLNCMWRPSGQPNRDNNAADCEGDEFNGLEGTKHSSTDRQFWVWIHASALTEAYDTLKLACQKEMEGRDIVINCFSLEGQLAKLELVGSKAFQLLQRTLIPATRTRDNSWKLMKHSAAKVDEDSQSTIHLKNEEEIPSHAILSLNVKDPHTLTEKGNTADAQDLGSASILGDVLGTEDKKHVIFGRFSDEPAGSGKIRANNVSSGVSPPVEEAVLCKEKHDQNRNFFCLDDSSSGELNTSSTSQGSRSCLIMLLKNCNGRGLHVGWSVIHPVSWVKAFWISLVSKGAHAMGLREKRWISCEVGLPYFPSDFPDCDAYLCLKENEAAASNLKEELRPPAIRPLRVPILSPWNSIRVALNEESNAVGDAESFRQQHGIRSNSSSNSDSGNSDATLAACHGNSFDGFIARMSFSLTNFLSEIQGCHLRLYPYVADKETSFTKFMRDEIKLGPVQDQFTRFKNNHKLFFVRVLLHAYKEGFLEEGAVICAPRLTDISLWTRSESFDGGLQLPQSAVASYFAEQSSGKWELQMPKDPVLRETYRLPIGFVTTGFVRGSKKPVAQAFCEAVVLACLREEQWDLVPAKRRRKEIYVLVRNLRSSAYRLALATIVLEHQEEDVEFL